MKQLTIYPSTGKLAKKILLPILAIIAVYVFVVVPDEDIGAADQDGFFTFMTWFIVLTIIGLIITYFVEMNRSKTLPVMQVTAKGVHFNRKGFKMAFDDEHYFTANERENESPPNDAGDMDFLLDRKESYIYVWKGKRNKVSQIRATYMNLNAGMIAALLNDLRRVPEEEREEILSKFHSTLTAKAGAALQQRVQLAHANANIDYESGSDGETSVAEHSELKKEHKKLALIVLGVWLLVSIVSSTMSEIDVITSMTMGFFGMLFSGLVLGLIGSLIPYKGLSFGQKFPRTTLIAMIITQVFSLLVVLVSI